jgi:hypothetical protein
MNVLYLLKPFESKLTRFCHYKNFHIIRCALISKGIDFLLDISKSMNLVSGKKKSAADINSKDGLE